jgi:glycosyltransferase involved in cell wall biosynthesis
MMKILIINHYAVPPVESGGTRHYSLGKELMKRGHKVKILAANFSHQKRVPLVPGVHESIHENHYDELPFIWIKVPPYKRNSPARAINMLSFTKTLLVNKYFRDMDRPDIVIGSSPHPFAAWAAYRLALRWNIPFVFEVRDLWPQSLIDLGRISPKHPGVSFLAKLEKHLYRNAVRIITLLPGARDYIQSLGIKSDKIVWVPNGIDVSLSLKEEHKTHTGLFTIMYAGNHGFGNGLENIVKCAEILNNAGHSRIIFRLIGDGPQKEYLRRIAAEKNLSNIRFEEPVPKKDIPTVLKQADAFIMLMKDSPVFKWGVSPNKLFDYLYAARPIIFAVNAYNNPVKEGKAGITVPPEDPQKLAEAVIRLYNMSYDERMQMGLNGQKYVLENHDFTALGAKLEKALLESIAIYNENKKRLRNNSGY